MSLSRLVGLILLLEAFLVFYIADRAFAAWYADPTSMTIETEINPTAICDGFHAELLARDGVGDGQCVYPENGPQFWSATDPRDGTWEDGSYYMPAGTKAAAYLRGQTPNRRFSNSPPGYRFHTWEHSIGTPTCPLTPDESICLDDCEPQWARNYLSEVYPRPSEWSFRSMGTPIPGEHASARAWDGSLSFTFPEANHVVATLAIRKEHSKGFGPGVDWMFNSQYAYFYGINRTVSMSALSCDGVAAGEDALVVDEVDLYTGPSGQLWTDGCALGDYANEGASVLCDIGLGDGVTTVSGLHVTSIDGAAVDLNHLRAGEYTGDMLPIPPPPLAEEVPSGEAAEVEFTLSPLDPGCLDDPVLLQEIANFNLAWAEYCYYDTVHYLDQGTHHGDGEGWKHPGPPAAVDYPGLSPRASGLYGHLYPAEWVDNVPEPGIGIALLAGVGMLMIFKRGTR